MATGITKDAGNYTFQVWMPEHTGDAALRDAVTVFGELGCFIEGYSDQLVGISCSRENALQVSAALRTAEQEGCFIYDDWPTTNVLTCR